MFKASQTALPLAAILLSAALPIAALISATPASAKTRGSFEPVSVVVDHRDLDLTDASDLAVLEQRIRSSVKRACPTLTRDLREAAYARQCRQITAARALEQKEIAVASAQANRPQFAAANDPKAVAAQ